MKRKRHGRKSGSRVESREGLACFVLLELKFIGCSKEQKMEAELKMEKNRATGQRKIPGRKGGAQEGMIG